MNYTPHENLVQDARAYPAIWRIVAGGVVAMAVYVGLIYATYGALAAAGGLPFADSVFSDVFVTTRTPVDALLLLFSFVFMIVGTLVAANMLHGRGLWSLVGAPGRAAAHFTRALLALIALYAVIWAILPAGLQVNPNLALATWLLFLPPALIAMMVQTGAEELLFRGYLQQQLAARFKRPLVWIGVPTVLFAWGHYLPEETGNNALAATLWTAVFALAAADLTARSGTLGAAIALHFANNVSSILLISLPGPVSGLALYTYPYSADDPALGPLLVVDAAVVFVSWLAVRVALRI